MSQQEDSETQLARYAPNREWAVVYFQKRDVLSDKRAELAGAILDQYPLVDEHRGFWSDDLRSAMYGAEHVRWIRIRRWEDETGQVWEPASEWIWVKEDRNITRVRIPDETMEL